MRILIVNQYAVPPWRSGGTRHYSLAEALAGRGHEIVIAAGAVDYTTGEEFAVPDTLVDTPTPHVWFRWLPVIKYRGNGTRRLWSMYQFGTSVRRLRTNDLPWTPDVVVGSSPHPFAALAALQWARRRERPFVLEIRDIWPDTLVGAGRLHRLHPAVLLFRRIERRLYKGANALITLLPGAPDYFASLGVNRSRVHVVPNGVAVGILERHAMPLKPRPPFVALYAGAHGHFNGLDTLLDAAVILQERNYTGRIIIRLIGDGPEKTRLQDRARQLGCSIVEFLPPVPKDEVADQLACAHATILHLRRADVFRWGISPNKLFDYMAAARPVVYAVETAFDPIAESGAGLSIPPENAEAMARSFIELFHMDDAQLLMMGHRGRQYVIDEHGIPLLAAQFERALESTFGFVA
ncbi:MAG: glycosyltransferase family 4 protein [Gemmatimonadaceae bacterium]